MVRERAVLQAASASTTGGSTSGHNGAFWRTLDEIGSGAPKIREGVAASTMPGV